MGPAIGAEKFEVGNEVREAFTARQPIAADAFKAGNKDKWFANIYALAALQMRDAGVVEIFGGDLCTYSDPKRFFSYRRDGETGRMATLAFINNENLSEE